MTYTIKEIKGTEAQYRYIKDVYQGLNKVDQKLFDHILFSQLLRPHRDVWDEEIYVPVSSEFIRKHFAKASWKNLEEAGLINYTGYSIERGKSREFAVIPEILDEFLKLGPKHPTDKIVNLANGRRYIPRPSSIYDENGNKIPELIALSISAIKTCPFNFNDMNELREKLEQKFDNDKKAHEAGEITDSTLLSAKGRYLNAKRIHQQVIAGAEHVEGAIYSYIPHYTVQMSGRVSERGGGLQSAPRAMKHAAFSNVPNLFNYDLKSSQLNIFITWVQEAGIDSTYLLQVRDDPNLMSKLAERVGLPRDKFKPIFYSVIMGATVSSNLERVKKRDVGNNSIMKTMSEAFPCPVELLRAYKELLIVLKPIKEVVDKWHNWLLDVYVPANRYRARGQYYLKNQTGAILNLTDLYRKPRHVIKSRLAAFLLQGREAAFIHHLTILGEKYDYSVVSNQHDGLTAKNPIPNEAVQEAIRLSGLECAKIVEKPFIDVPPPPMSKSKSSARGFGKDSTTKKVKNQTENFLFAVESPHDIAAMKLQKLYDAMPKKPLPEPVKPDRPLTDAESSMGQHYYSVVDITGSVGQKWLLFPAIDVDGSMYLPPVSDESSEFDCSELENISEEEEEAIVDRARNTFSNILRPETDFPRNKRKLLEMWRWIQLKRLMPKIYGDDYSIEEKYRYAYFGHAIAHELLSSSEDGYAYLLLAKFRIVIEMYKDHIHQPGARLLHSN